MSAVIWIDKVTNIRIAFVWTDWLIDLKEYAKSTTRTA